MKVILIASIIICLAASSGTQECTIDGRLVKCSRQEAPVCGVKIEKGQQIHETFVNHCIACVIGKSEFTVEGKCENFPKDAEFCSPQDSKAEGCPKNLDPHCGWFDNHVACLVYPCAINGGNRCDACRHEHVLYTTPGVCPNPNGK